jgi:hypothetical protein
MALMAALVHQDATARYRRISGIDVQYLEVSHAQNPHPSISMEF